MTTMPTFAHAATRAPVGHTVRAHCAGAVLAATLIAAGTPAAAEMVRYEIDPEHVTVAFMVDHVGYANTLGIFRDVSGHFMFDPEARELGAVEITVDAASVWTNNERRDEHVRNADFLDVENHPAVSFTAMGGEATGETTGTVTGDLTILGQTKPITLEVELNKIAPYPFGHKRETIGASIRGTVVRSMYGMDYAVANGLVGDEVELLIEIEAIKAE